MLHSHDRLIVNGVYNQGGSVHYDVYGYDDNNGSETWSTTINSGSENESWFRREGTEAGLWEDNDQEEGVYLARLIDEVLEPADRGI